MKREWSEVLWENSSVWTKLANLLYQARGACLSPYIDFFNKQKRLGFCGSLVIRRLDWWLVGQVLEVEGDWKAIGETIIKYLESEVNNLFIDMGANNLIKCLS